jgi:FKBP-type peptidyl-prolyl cis-trans isomerase 2
MTTKKQSGEKMTDDEISKGDHVSVNYTGSFEDGEIFDSSVEEKVKGTEIYNPQRKYEPLCIKVGAGQLIKGFENALMGMKKGDEKEVTLPPEEAYGNYDDNLKQNIPMDAFKQANVTPEVGIILNTQAGMGKIIKVNESDVEVDFNSPMAGKTLKFSIKVEDVTKGKPGDEAGCGGGCPCSGG